MGASQVVLVASTTFFMCEHPACLKFASIIPHSLAGASHYRYREYWAISTFELNTDLPNDNLDEELELYPAFQSKLRRLNVAALVLSSLLFFAVLVNFIVSGVLIANETSSTSITSLISNTLLIAPKVLGWLSALCCAIRERELKSSRSLSYSRLTHVLPVYSYNSVFQSLPYSLFSKNPVLPNTIDPAFRFKDGYYTPNIADISVISVPMAVATTPSGRLSRLSRQQR